jgi:biopolymer transport protein ExbD
MNQKRRFKSRLKEISHTSAALTPLVDVVFLLLIFFMLGSSMVFQPGITVNMPESYEDTTLSPVDKLVIMITAEDLVFFNDRPMESWEALEQQIGQLALDRSAQKSGRRPVIILKADRKTKSEDMIRVMSITQKHKMTLFLGTKMPDE